MTDHYEPGCFGDAHPSDDDPIYDEEHCAICGAPLDDGEGYDGLCGDCADEEENNQ